MGASRVSTGLALHNVGGVDTRPLRGVGPAGRGGEKYAEDAESDEKQALPMGGGGGDSVGSSRFFTGLALHNVGGVDTRQLRGVGSAGRGGEKDAEDASALGAGPCAVKKAQIDKSTGGSRAPAPRSAVWGATHPGRQIIDRGIASEAALPLAPSTRRRL